MTVLIPGYATKIQRRWLRSPWDSIPTIQSWGFSWMLSWVKTLRKRWPTCCFVGSPEWLCGSWSFYVCNGCSFCERVVRGQTVWGVGDGLLTLKQKGLHFGAFSMTYTCQAHAILSFTTTTRKMWLIDALDFKERFIQLLSVCRTATTTCPGYSHKMGLGG